MFERFFVSAFREKVRPFSYQRALAERDWPDVLVAPTGLGKTAAVVLGWAWKHVVAERTPARRLVYCLPMRTLVEQTEQNVRQWLRRLGETDQTWKSRLPDPEADVHVLMGGADEPKWYEKPERPAILIGTQDMLLSRALMRGYAMSRFRWPVDFALLHNDAQWIFDEVQLMGSGLATSAQLEGFRRKLETSAPTQSLWLSATLHPAWLRTIDFPYVPRTWRVPEDFEEDEKSERVRKLIDAPKLTQKLDITPASAKNADLTAYSEELAVKALSLHRKNRMTLIVVNTVQRAQAVYSTLKKQKGVSSDSLVLIHSRFRSEDRKTQMDKLPRPGEDKDLIVVATQAVEAGVDISATVMFTEIAPSSSLAQRFGRVNRYGELNEVGGGTIRWIDLLGENPEKNTASDSLAAPYTIDDLKAGRERILALTDARPSNLAPPDSSDYSSRWVIRSKDVIDLYDTDPDLTGFDVDVSPYVRDAEDTDIRVFWRKFDSPTGPQDEPPPLRSELCAVPIGRARDWLKQIRSKKDLQAFHVDPQARGAIPAWVRLDGEVWPGVVLMVHSSAGGYEADMGFDPSIGAPVEPVEKPSEEPVPEAMDESSDADPDSEPGIFVGLTDHLGHVAGETVSLCNELAVQTDRSEPIVHAARWHDLGKAHEAFQARMTTDDPQMNPRPQGLLAKAPKYDRGEGRPYFRHELASALAYLSQKDWSREADLVAYLIAAHHGKVRLNLRSLPAESPPKDTDGRPDERRFARGVWEDDSLPSVDLGAGVTWAGGRLTLSPMELGEHPTTGASWAERTRNLLSEFGPFRLAWMEALVRIADWRASAKEREGEYDD